MKTFSAFDSGVNTSLDLRSTDLAIIGLSCRFPGAATPAAFWQNLCAGVESIAFFTEQELAVLDPRLTSDPNYVKAAAVLPDIDLFDAAFFGINHKEAALLDPQQRLFLECAWHALEDAGYAPATYDGLIGVYAGAGMNTYLVNNVHPAYGFSPHRTFLESMNDLQVRLGNDAGYISTRVSYKLNLRGPSVNIQTACSTALVAVHAAGQSLLAGECDMALAGAVALRVPQKTGHLYQEDMIFSPDGHCRSFDAAAQGTVFGDGVGIVVLKLLEQAVADGDTIHAVIKGSAINNDGAVKVGYTAPSIQGQRTVIAEALAIADVDAATITYLEAHGTATALGDPIEITALTQAFREHTPATGYCALGSVKTNIGHLAEAAGMAGLIKTILALKHKALPPSLHFTTPNPKIDFDHSPFYVNTKLAAWETPATSPRRAGVSAFGMGGTNAHLILEEAPLLPPTANAVERPLHLLTLSAKTEQALHTLVQHYAAYLTEHPAAPLADLCFTTNAGRQHFSQRVAIVARSTAQLHSELTTLAATNPLSATAGSAFLGQAPERSTATQGVAFLFTGQGSQYVEMARQLYETSDPEHAVFRQTLDACDALLQDGGYLAQSLPSILYPAPGAPSPLDETAYTQPALFAVEYALAQLWLSWGIRPAVVLGHSLGEYVAACIAGVFTLEDALRLVAERGRLMQATAAGAMAAVMADEAQVLAAISAHHMTSQVAIAALNGPQNIVIAGECQAVATVCQALEAQSIKTRKLNVSHAFHSPLMTPILAEFAQVAHGITYAPAQIPLISNLTGQLATADIATPDYWVRHIRQPVRFADSIVTLRQLKQIETLLEIGPTPTLLSMASDRGQGPWSADAAPNAPSWLLLPTLRPGHADWETLLTSLGQLYVQGHAIDWVSFGQLYNHRRLSLPTYPFQRQRHWIDAPKVDRAQPAMAYASNHRHSGVQPADQHPLLGQRVRLAGTPDQYFEAHLSPLSLEWLADHQILETTVLPEAAYAEIALAAGAVVAPATALHLQDLQIVRTFDFPENSPQVGQTVLKPDGEQGYQFAFYRLTQNNTADAAAPIWQLHATARLQTGQAAAPPKPPLDLPAFQNSCRLAVAVDGFYQRLAQQGVVYGADARPLQAIWRQAEGTAPTARALAHLVLPPAMAQELAHYHLHPALLDAAWQVIQLLADADPLAQPFVSVGLERLTLYQAPGAEVWSAVQLRQPGPMNGQPAVHPERIVADLYLFNSTGELVADIEGIQFTAGNDQARLAAESSRQLQTLEQAWLYQVAWRQQKLAAETALPVRTAAGQGRHWLIFADRGGIGQQVQTLLQQRGDTCTLLFQTTAAVVLSPPPFYLDPTDANRLQQRLAALPAPPYGVLHLWSLDAPAPHATSDLDLAMRLGCESLLHLLQALSQQAFAMPRLWVVTRGAQAVLAEDGLPGLHQAPLWGMGKVIGLEYPDSQLVCIDLASSTVAESASADAQAIGQELLTTLPAEQVAYRHYTRYVARLVRTDQIQEPLPAQPAAMRPAQLVIEREATYLITGGLGGLGLLVARWLAERGAQHLVLVSRRGVNPAKHAQLQSLEKLGAQIIVAQTDVADGAQMTDLFAQIKRSLPPLRGVIHAAGVDDAGILQQMSWARFAAVLAPKMLGSWHLHCLTQGEALDFFVMFSSVTSLLGIAGEGNYAAANAFLDALAHHRRAQGLPATSINWGAWSGVGMAVERQLEEYLRQRGLGMIPPQIGVQLLERMIVRAPIQIGIIPITWARLRPTLPAQAPFFSELLASEFAGKTAPASPEASGATFQKQWLAAAEDERNRLLNTLVREQIGKILGLQETQTISRAKGFFELGMDSLAAVELRNHVQNSTGLRLPNTLAFDYPTLDTLVAFLTQKLLLLEPKRTPTEGPSPSGYTNGNATGYATQPRPRHTTNGHATEHTPRETGEVIDDIAQRLAAQLGLN